MLFFNPLFRFQGAESLSLSWRHSIRDRPQCQAFWEKIFKIFFGLNDLLSLLTEPTLAGNDPAVKRFLKNLLAEAAGVEPASKVLETPILPLN